MHGVGAEFGYGPAAIHPKWSKQLKLGQFHCERLDARRARGEGIE